MQDGDHCGCMGRRRRIDELQVEVEWEQKREMLQDVDE